MVDMIKKWWKNTKMSPIEKYLSESSNLADLERLANAGKYDEAKRLMIGR